MRLKDRQTSVRLIRAGVIRLGHKETKIKHRANGETYEVEYPVQDDHFVLTDAPEIAVMYGDTPQVLDVMLPFPTPEGNFDAGYNVWAGGVLVCRGDGALVDYAVPFTVDTREKDGKTYVSVRNAPGDTLVSHGVAQVAFDWNGEHFNLGDHVPCSGAKRNLYPHCAACRMTAILKLMMAKPELIRAAYYQLATGSGYNHDVITDTLDLIYSEFGKVSGIHYRLQLVERPTTYKDADGLRKKTKKWFIHLEPCPEDLQALWTKKRVNMFMLPSRTGEPVDEVDEVEEGVIEFVPDEPAPPPFAEGDGPATNEPAEEPKSEPKPTPTPKPKQKSKPESEANNRPKRQWPYEVVQAIIAAGAENSYAACGVLNHSTLAVTDELDVCVEWYKKYRAARDGGKAVVAAATEADAWLDSVMQSTAEQGQGELPL